MSEFGQESSKGSHSVSAIERDHFLEGVMKEEKMEKNRDGLWKEPNFSEWYDKVTKKEVKPPLKKGNNSSNNRPVLNFNIDDSF